MLSREVLFHKGSAMTRRWDYRRPQWLGSLGAQSGSAMKLLEVDNTAAWGAGVAALEIIEGAAKPTKARVITAVRTRVFMEGLLRGAQQKQNDFWRTRWLQP
jgi:hypothetical protein